MNSFFELEPDYANHYRNVLNRKAWHIGPLSLCNKDIEDKEVRGKKAAIDEHELGGFVTHCGWNSTLEGVCAGLAMVTWPVFAEQFYNEKLVTEVLRIGVSVGVKEWNSVAGQGIRREVVEKAVKRIMVEEKGEEMRRRAKELKEKAKQVIEEGGSSYNDLSALTEELSSLNMRSRSRELK
ncbi:hypothetical protein LguiA_008028 [Lonicera macranthoides]